MFDDRRELERRPQVQLELGRVVATPGAIAALAAAGETGERYLFRHEHGDWGDLSEDDRFTNNEALQSGARILSSYVLPTGEELWIITEWDRSVTTLLLSAEY